MKDVIESPLWDLMISTNNCYPGCACKDDYFQITVARVTDWVKSVGSETANRALPQIHELQAKLPAVFEPITWQTNIAFKNTEDVHKWLAEWNSLLRGILA